MNRQLLQKVFSALGLTVALLLAACGGGGDSSSGEGACNISSENYNRISSGMNTIQVSDILGCPGSRVSGAISGSYTHRWSNQGSTDYIMAGFTDSVRVHGILGLINKSGVIGGKSYTQAY